jgi:hypothetical protein
MIVKMKILKGVLSFIMISILLLHSIKNIAYASLGTPSQKPVRAAVFLNDLSYLFISEVKEKLRRYSKRK